MSKSSRKIVVTSTNLPASSLLKPLAQYLYNLELELASIFEEPQNEPLE